MKKYILTSLLFLLLAAGCSKNAPVSNNPSSSLPDYKNASYTLDGRRITLVNGRYEGLTGPSSPAKTVVQYFGNEAHGDFNGDGTEDVAFLVTGVPEGSGTFFYLVAALKTASGTEGTNGVLIGDRIAPQTTEFKDGEIIVNYADRKADEPMTTAPSVGISKYFKISGGQLVPVQK